MSAVQELIRKAESREALFGIIGLGYVGLPLAVELAKAGYTVLGYDVNQRVVDGLNAGKSHIKDVSDAELGEQVSFVGINIRDLAPENAQAFERDRGVDYPSIYDPGSETLDEFGRYRPASMPSTAVLDRPGRVAALISGEIPSQTTLVTLVEGLLDEDSDG